MVFNTRLQQIALGKEEDNPQRWFRDRRISIIKVQHSIEPEALYIDVVLVECYELSRFAELNMLTPTDILVVSDDKDFLLMVKEQGFHTAAPNDIDGIIRRILTIEYQKEV